MQLNSNVPSGPLEGKWDRYKFDLKRVNPANKRKFEIIVVGTGLAGGSAAATLADLGYKVKKFLHPRLSAKSTQYCSPGRYQRSKKLSW
jgi:succinate dehydrogenase subunit A (EC 1.3.5.1)